ncbi:MAG: SRPBCC domain-containing protein [Candidatus Asgardarchaeia archaeon]
MAIEKVFLFLIDAPTADVWAYFTDVSKMTKWLAPEIKMDFEEKAELFLKGKIFNKDAIEEGFLEHFIPFKKIKLLFTQRLNSHKISYTTKFTTAPKNSYAALEFVLYVPDQDVPDIKYLIDVGGIWSERVLDLKNLAEGENVSTGISLEEKVNLTETYQKIKLFEELDTVWEFATNKEKLKLWFEETNLELKKSGKIEVFLDESILQGTVTSVKPKQEISFSWKIPETNTTEQVNWIFEEKQGKTIMTCNISVSDPKELHRRRALWSNYLLTLATKLYVIRKKK